ncbi:membrane bound O-acyl transferase family-domain-containing protein [Annulohypoxylon bovei var. microspora]|nr:membrane bound O-acyl transferase family-domain-containing protein [Annulohypoxylon bovei var. microspora]
MDRLVLLHPFFCFIIGTSFFYFAIRQPLGQKRHTLNLLHAFSMINCLCGASLLPSPYSRMWAQFIVWASIHTLSVLSVEKQVIHLDSIFFIQRLRVIFRAWSNIRRLPLLDDTTGTILHGSADDNTTRLSFALLRCGRTIVLWLTYRISTDYISHTFLPSLNVSLQDFAPAKQIVWPPMTTRDLYLRVFFSVYWIWDSYAILTISHDLLALFFVCILRWDMPQEWPPLFGNIVDAYSLRRFWGVFWHRLHVAYFAMLMPSYLNGHYEQHRLQDNSHQEGSRVKIIVKALKALWIFLLSGICHVAVNFATMRNGNTRGEIRFFILNYILCLLETIIQRLARGKFRQPARGSIWVRLFGYGWVFLIFFCVVPAWQYSLVYMTISSRAQVPG